MRRKISKKHIGVVGVMAFMAVQTPAMATEMTQKSTTQEEIQENNENIVDLSLEESSIETSVETQAEETQAVEVSDENQTEGVESVETSAQETQTEEVVDQEAMTASDQTEDVASQEIQTPEMSTENETSMSINEDEVGNEEIEENNTEAIEPETTQEEESSSEVLTDGWHIDSEGNYTYVKDGELVCNKVILIDGSYYGFDYNGKMYADIDFRIYSGEGSPYHRAKADGSLYVNEWYNDKAGERYYYGNEGRAYLGAHEIDGKPYYFDYNGQLCKNISFSAKDGTIYYCDADGVATNLNNGWNQIDGAYIYVKDGKFLKNCVEQIGPVYYGFDKDGKMYIDTDFFTWTMEGYEEGNTYYRAKADGSLYVNEWYKNSNGKTYYYGENGRLQKNCVIQVGAKYYGFAKNGQMYADTSFSVWNYKERKYLYYRAKADGSLYVNKWYYENGLRYYYGEDGRAYSGVYEINGKRYGFDENGQMYADTSFSVWNSEEGKYLYYRANADGSLYVNKWYEDERARYYYGEEGRAYSGVCEINGKLYCFYEYGTSCRNTSFTAADGTIYYCDADGVATKLNNGWNQIDGVYIYVKDGKLLENCVEQIGPVYYGFDYNGKMHADTSFSVWNSEERKYFYYRAKADGSLYVNRWYKDSDGNYYYYGEDGKAYSDLNVIDGKNYCFSIDGQLRRNTIEIVNGKSYYCDKEGIAIELKDNAWNYLDSKKVYIKDGQVLKNCVTKIDGSYYGFDYDGNIYSNTFFSIMENGIQEYYWASASGALYTNKWYYESYWYNLINTNIYYYGEDGKRCKGIYTIDGVQYGFTEDGKLAVYKSFTMNGKSYYCDSEGRIHEISNNKWYKSDNGDWYYVQNGTLLKDCHAQIGGKWYGFDIYGKMVTNELNANEDGSLRINTWINDGRYWHYYGSDGAMYLDGIYEINGKNYYFSNGNMAVSQVCSWDGNSYRVDENGYAVQIPNTGWIKAGKDYYYTDCGQLICNTVKKINGVYYGFARSGKMYVDTTFRLDFWDTDKRKQVWYKAKKDGSLYTSQWYQDVIGNWYYYNQNAERTEGIADVHGIKYLFGSTGVLKSNGAVESNGKYYLADENGRLKQVVGWIQDKGNWYYGQEDGSLYMGLLEDKGHTYYMDPVMVTNTELEKIDNILYNIDANGYVSVAADGFYWSDGRQHNGNYVGELYYVSDGKSVEVGWKQIGRKWYYFESNGMGNMCKAIKGKKAVIDGKYYLFNEKGELQTNGWKVADGDGNWYYAQDDSRIGKDQTWYYVLESGALATGDTQINGKWYHFSESGELKTGAVMDSGVCKLYDEDGTVLGVGKANGWNLLGGNYYYVKDGSILKDGSYKLPDGKWYSFNSDGVMQKNTRLWGHWHDESGAALTGWFQLAGKWYYAAKVDGLLYKGLHTINGSKYYFDDDGVMQTGEFVIDEKVSRKFVEDYASWTEDVVVNRKVVTTNKNGAIIGSAKLKDGWSSYNGERYYYKNGKAYTGWVGDYYIENGCMLRNQVIDVSGKKYYNGDSNLASLKNKYYIGEDGTCQKNKWVNNGWFYAKADGTLAQNEWLKIDGKIYYFDPYYCVARGFYNNVTGSEVYDKDSTFMSSKGYSRGWSLINGTYYYKEGDNFICSQAKKINGAWYLFDAHGKMVTGFSVGESATDGMDYYSYDGGKYYYGKDGRRCDYTGWKQLDGKWYYFNSAFEAVSGWRNIGGVKYYFDLENRAMYTGYHVINRKLYYFDSNGKCTNTAESKKGWYKLGEDWYYMRDGYAVTGKNIINNTEYDFDGKGVLISN